MSWPALFARELATLPPPLRELTNEVLRLVPDTADDALLRVAAQEQLERLAPSKRELLREGLRMLRANLTAPNPHAHVLECVTCGEEFGVDARRRWTTKYCPQHRRHRVYRLKPQEPAPCAWCGETLPATRRASSKYCGVKCKRSANDRSLVAARQAGPRLCDQCGMEIPRTRRRGRKRCSDPCDAEAMRKARNQWAIAHRAQLRAKGVSVCDTAE